MRRQKGILAGHMCSCTSSVSDAVSSLHHTKSAKMQKCKSAVLLGELSGGLVSIGRAFEAFGLLPNVGLLGATLTISTAWSSERHSDVSYEAENLLYPDSICRLGARGTHFPSFCPSMAEILQERASRVPQTDILRTGP